MPGYCLRKIRQDRQQFVQPERNAAVDAQPAARRRPGRDLAFGGIHVVENAHGLFVESSAFRGELQLTGRAVDEARAEPRFKTPDQFADGRWRHAQGPRRRRETAEFDDPGEHFHFAGSVHVQPHNEFNS